MHEQLNMPNDSLSRSNLCRPHARCFLRRNWEVTATMLVGFMVMSNPAVLKMHGWHARSLTNAATLLRIRSRRRPQQRSVQNKNLKNGNRSAASS